MQTRLYHPKSVCCHSDLTHHTFKDFFYSIEFNYQKKVFLSTNNQGIKVLLLNYEFCSLNENPF